MAKENEKNEVEKEILKTFGAEALGFKTLDFLNENTKNAKETNKKIGEKNHE